MSVKLVIISKIKEIGSVYRPYAIEQDVIPFVINKVFFNIKVGIQHKYSELFTLYGCLISRDVYTERPTIFSRRMKLMNVPRLHTFFIEMA